MTYTIAAMDPAVAQAIGSLSGALSVLIIAIASYYFPKDHDKFDDDKKEEDD